MVAAAVAGSAVVAGVAGSAMSANAAKGAANTQAQSARDSMDSNERMFNQMQEKLNPYTQLGEDSIGDLQALLNGGKLSKQFSFNGTDLQNTPGYQFTLQQGLRGVDNAAAAKGLGLSGAQLKGISDYSTGLANTTYNDQYANALNAFNTNYGVSSDQYNRLAGLVSLGQNAAAGVGNAGLQTAANNANLLTSAGNAQAAGAIGQANAYSSGLNSVAQGGLLYSLMK